MPACGSACAFFACSPDDETASWPIDRKKCVTFFAPLLKGSRSQPFHELLREFPAGSSATRKKSSWKHPYHEKRARRTRAFQCLRGQHQATTISGNIPALGLSSSYD